MEYTVIQDEKISTLRRLVNEHIENGWRCQGGIAMIETLNHFWYVQAMIRETNP